MCSRQGHFARTLEFACQPWLAALILYIACLAVAGCGGSAPTSSGNSSAKVGGEAVPAKDQEPGITAEDILRRSAKAYVNSKTYSDEGVLLVKFPETAEPSRFPFSVAFERKGKKLRISAYQVTLACDGKRMRGFIEDELSNNLDGQFLDAAAPAKFAPETLIEDAEVASIFSQGAGGPPPVLEWLIAQSPFGEILSTPKRLKKLPSREVDGRSYYRIQIDLSEPANDVTSDKKDTEKSPSTFIVLWIDQTSSLVEKLEYPHIFDAAKAEQPDGKGISITAEFRKAQIDKPVESEQFVLKPTSEAKVVSFFVAPPPPMPRERLGKVPPKFELDVLEGGKVTSEQLLGKTSILLFVRDHGACEEAAKQLEAVYAALGSDKRFDFRIVVNESRDVSNVNMTGMLKRWGISIPATRDSGPATGDSLGIKSLPTLVILDAKGRMQLSQAFGFSSVSSTLPAVCEQIASGENIFQRLLDSQTQYEARLAVARSGGKPSALELSPTKIAPASLPTKIKLETAWELPEFNKVGCLITTPIGGKPTLIALQAPHTIHSISTDGKTFGNIDPKLPDGAVLNVIRSTTDDKKQSVFMAFSPGGEAAYLLNEQGELLSAFPPTGQPHEGVADALVSDLDGKQGVEGYVGFSAFLGVQATDDQGKRLWRNLAIPSVISLAAGPKNVAGWRKLFATDDRGRIIMLNQFGKHELIELEDREIHRLFSRNDDAAELAGPGDSIYCGISFQGKDNLLAIGFDSEFGETWTYTLPPGIFVGPVQYVAALPLPNSSTNGIGELWIIAAPDGSIHFIGSQGKFADSFSTGQRILAMTTMLNDGKPTLVYATEKGIHAAYIGLPPLNSEPAAK